MPRPSGRTNLKFAIIRLIQTQEAQSYCFREIFPFGRSDFIIHVTALAVDHHNIQILVLIHEGVFISDDITMS